MCFQESLFCTQTFANFVKIIGHTFGIMTRLLRMGVLVILLISLFGAEGHIYEKVICTFGKRWNFSVKGFYNNDFEMLLAYNNSCMKIREKQL